VFAVGLAALVPSHDGQIRLIGYSRIRRCTWEGVPMCCSQFLIAHAIALGLAPLALAGIAVLMSWPASRWQIGLGLITEQCSLC